MLKERLSRLDGDKDDHVHFEELTTVLDDAHRGRWGKRIGLADVKALAATLESTAISVMVGGTEYSTGTGSTVTTGLSAWTPTASQQQPDAPDAMKMRSFPYISLTWTASGGTLDFRTKPGDFRVEFGTAVLAAINGAAHGTQGTRSTMWRYIYTVTAENTSMDFNGMVSTCLFLEGTGLADCYDWGDQAAGSSPLQLGPTPGPRFGGNGNGPNNGMTPVGAGVDGDGRLLEIDYWC